ncbi:hypothetical protein ACFFJX_14470 [Pseudarcicella hirudinis]
MRRYQSYYGKIGEIVTIAQRSGKDGFVVGVTITVQSVIKIIFNCQKAKY